MRRLTCTLIALIVLAPTLAMAQAFRCAGDGETHERCCCPEAEDGDETAPALLAACCCDRIDGTAPRAGDRTSVTADLLRAPALALLSTPTTVLPPPRDVPRPSRADRARSPPAPAAPLFLRHCALLR